MAPDSSILVRRSPWREDPGGLQSMGSQRVRRYWATNSFTQFAAGLSLQPLGGSAIMRHEVLSTSFKLSTVLDDKKHILMFTSVTDLDFSSESPTYCTARACVMIIAGREAWLWPADLPLDWPSWVKTEESLKDLKHPGWDKARLHPILKCSSCLSEPDWPTGYKASGYWLNVQKPESVNLRNDVLTL